jgi:hypothetical protein
MSFREWFCNDTEGSAGSRLVQEEGGPGFEGRHFI